MRCVRDGILFTLGAAALAVLGGLYLAFITWGFSTSTNWWYFAARFLLATFVGSTVFACVGRYVDRRQAARKETGSGD